jgi:hypothetical protein
MGLFGNAFDSFLGSNDLDRPVGSRTGRANLKGWLCYSRRAT